MKREDLKKIIKEIIKEVCNEITTTASTSPINTPKAFSKRKIKETPEKLEEITTTGDASGYNIPAAFSRRGGSKKGVEGSGKLGYELTPIGKKDMDTPGDKL